jgi:hypothetical protein
MILIAIHNMNTWCYCTKTASITLYYTKSAYEAWYHMHQASFIHISGAVLLILVQRIQMIE